ncbi:MAG: ATP-binding protein [Pseudomonadota bacterium]
MMNKQKILVVDDEPVNISILVEALQSEYKTIVAKNGEQALQRAQADPVPDLILLDILMPDMDGYEVCRRLKENESTVHIPVIFITAMSDVGYETKGLECGAVDYITKPISPAIVKVRVKHHLERELYQLHLEDLVQARTLEIQKSKATVEAANRNLRELLKNEKQLTIQAEAANRAKTDFLHTISHELLTPLNAIIGFNSLLGYTGLDDKQADYVQTIRERAKDLNAIISDILVVAEIGTGVLRLEKSNFLLETVVEDTVKRVSTGNGCCRLEIEPELPNALKGDSRRLTRVFGNLVSNAVKFSKEKADITIGIKTTSKSERKAAFQFSIADRGIGIDADNLAKLFDEPFTQVDTSDTRLYEGLGLGLYISKSLVEMMGGRIWAESEPDQGSTFFFTAEFERQAEERPFSVQK